MIFLKKIITVLFLFLSITSCVDKYWPEVDKYEYVLVVDGMLTNGINPINVKLSFSSPVNDKEIIPTTNCELYITDENQIETHLIETEPGTYIAYDSSFRGQIGSSYQLYINLPNGKKYESDICFLKSPSPIDSVYGLEETHTDIYYNKNLSGIQYYIDNHPNNTNDTNNYLWRLTQTFKYEACFTLDYTWEGEIIPYPNPDSLRTCWYTGPVSDIFIFSTKHYDKTEIKKFPLAYISTESKALSIRYSLLVRQLSISEDAFNFFTTLEQQNIEQGNLYSEQPIQVRGNINNINNIDEPVLGYFIVAGVTEKRIFTDRPKLPFYYYVCYPDYDLRGLRFVHSRYWPIYLTQDEVAMALAERLSCFDCREEGGLLTPPDFWEE